MTPHPLPLPLEREFASPTNGPVRALVLLQMGGPSTLDDLRPFYQRLFEDPDIIQLPAALRAAQPALAATVARVRAVSMRKRYRQIGGGSPLKRHTESLADELARALEKRGTPTTVHYAMRYSEPSARPVVASLLAAGARSVDLLPLYPHWSRATTGSSVADFQQAAQSLGFDAEVRVVEPWGDDPGYVDLLVGRIEDTLAGLRAGWGGPVHLLFSAHGLPERYVAQGDPYPDQVRRTAEAIGARVRGFDGWSLSFQSRLGPVRWLQPSTDLALRRLAAEGVRALVVVPLGFVSDHIETLYDIDILYREEAADLGIRHYHRVPSFNGDPAFARVLVSVLERHAGATTSAVP